MEAELSDATFESRLTYIKEKYLSYVNIKESSPFVVIVLHEHLGLSNYIRVIVQALCNNETSIVIPNLFGQASDLTNHSEEDDAFLRRLNHEMIAQAIWDVVEEIKRTNKKIILVGFSVGAAFGLKILEFIQGIQFSMFFYGFPPAAEIKPMSIKCRTIVYVGTKDKVKFLADKQALKACKRKYQDNQLVQIYELSGLDHGFMNPASQNYDEDAFRDCCKQFQGIINHIRERQQEKRQQQNQNKTENIPEQKKGEKGGEQQKQQGKCQLI